MLLITLSIVGVNTLLAQKKPMQVAINAQYYFSFYFDGEFDHYGSNYFEHNHRVGLELELDTHWVLGYDRFFINSTNFYLGKKSWTANIYMIKYKFQVPKYERFSVGLIANLARTDYTFPEPFNHRDVGKRFFYGAGVEVSYNIKGRWFLSAQYMPMFRGIYWNDYDILTISHIGFKRNLFKRLDPDR